MDGFRVNGVMVSCAKCCHRLTKVDEEPCKGCYQTIHHNGDIEEISFDPVDKNEFLALEKLVAKYRNQFKTMHDDAKAHGIPVRKLVSQFADHNVLEVSMRIK